MVPKLPTSWEWVRLGAIGEINPRNTYDDDQKAGFVPMPLIFSDYRKDHLFETRLWGEIKKGYTHFANGDIGLAKITPCFENAKSCIFKDLPNGFGAGTTELHIYRNTFSAIYPEYLLAYFKNPKYIATGIPKMTGSAGQKRVPKDFFSHQPFPLPPLPEQRRIVAKIDQLMARCDELEKLRTERDQKRLTVHTAALNRLLTAQSSDTSTDAWRFIAQHFGELYSVKENVAELRKAILQLAVMGKLVEQDPSDEPASELLEKIETEKQQLLKEGKIKKAKPLPEIRFEEVPYSLPEKWSWSRLGVICNKVSDGFHHAPQKLSQGIRYISATHIFDGGIDWNSGLYVAEQEYLELFRKTRQGLGDILIVNRGAGCGDAAIVDKSFEFCFQNAAIIGFSQTLLSSRYILRYLQASRYLLLRKFIQGGAQPMLSNKLLSTHLIPIPPFSEQHRIVAKVDQLMALCDTLEQHIDNATHKQTTLLNAIMAQV